MATAYTRADQIGLYLTAPLDNADAGNVSACLGGARQAQQVRQLDAMIEGELAPIIVEQIGGIVGEGSAQVRAVSTTTVAYTAPDGEEGTAVTIADGGVVLLEGETSSEYVRIRRDGSDLLADALTLDVRKIYDNLIAIGDVSAADNTAGIDEYLAGMLCAHGDAGAAATKVYIGTLAPQQVSDIAQLAATGTGTIEANTTDAFEDWPASGYARVTTAGGTLREIVYYTSRTAQTLLITDEAHRALLGTSMAAGAVDDVIDCVPGIRIGVEAPDSDGFIQTIADRETAPTGITWSTAITAAAGLSVPALPTLGTYGLWIHRQIPPAITESIRSENVICLEIDGTYTQKYYGLYRVQSTQAARAKVFIGEDARPDFDAAPEYSGAPTFPIVIVLTPPPSGQKTFNVCVRETDPYGLEAYNSYAHPITIDSTGAQVHTALTPVIDAEFVELGSGYVQLRARYPLGFDELGADYFRYYLTTDGTAPDPGTDTPVDTIMRIGGGGPWRSLTAELGPYDYGTQLKAIIRPYNSTEDVEGDSIDVVTHTIALVAAPAPALPSAGMGGVSAYDSGAAFPQTIAYLNAPTNTVYWKYRPGTTELWAGSQLVFRAMASGQNQITLHIPAAFSLTEGAVSGAGSANPVEVSSATRLYLCVAGQRVADINVAAFTITAPSFDASGAILPEDTPVVGPSLALDDFSCFQVYDPAQGRWRSFLCVDNAGVFSARWLAQTAS